MQSDDYLRCYELNETIFTQGSDEQQFFIVITGRVEIRRHQRDHAEAIRVLGPGEFFGELAVIDGVSRSASAVAVEEHTQVMVIDKARFIYLVSQQPAFALMIMETLARWLRGIPDGGTGSADTRGTGKVLTSPLSVIQVRENIYQFRSRTRSCNTYLFKGARKHLLIDPGLGASFDCLVGCLGSLGLSPSDIDLVVLTHEHFDHVAAVPQFGAGPLVAAHHLAANKIANQDDFAILSGAFAESGNAFSVDWTLAEGTLIDTGSNRLRVHYTPGHTSGCISLIEQEFGLLVSGDMVMAGGPIGGVFGSGNISDTIYSLELLAGLSPKCLLPGHGPVSDDPQHDIFRTLGRSQKLLSDSRLIFDTLNGRESINKIILSVRDLSR